jgi:hypothetical protein
MDFADLVLPKCNFGVREEFFKRVFAPTEASFLKASSRLHCKFAPMQQWHLRSSLRLGAKLAPRRKVGAYASFKKTALRKVGA